MLYYKVMSEAEVTPTGLTQTHTNTHNTCEIVRYTVGLFFDICSIVCVSVGDNSNVFLIHTQFSLCFVN
jgi:hypothetical protein